MGIVISAKNLLSRATRQSATGNSSGLRKINLFSGAITKTEKGGLIQQIFNAGGKFISWIAGEALKFLSWSITGIWDWVVEKTIELSQFNWNASDQELQVNLQSVNEQLGSIWGGLTGSGIGWLAAMGLGFGVSLVVPVIGGPMLARSIAGKVAIEAGQDLTSRLFAAIFQTFNVGATNATVNTYINFRKWLKDPNNKLLDSLFPKETAAKIRKDWGKQGGPQWTIAKAIDDKVNSIKNPLLRGFVQGLTSESFESFIEGGYVVAYELENAYEQAKLARQTSRGGEKEIILVPDREVPEETIVLTGNKETTIQEVQTALTSHRLVYNRDVGMIAGEAYRDDAHAPVASLRQLKIVFKAKAKPPYRDAKGNRPRETYCTISDVDRGLTWGKVKFAAKHWTWGKCYAVGRFASRRKMVVYGATETEAERKLKELAVLSSSRLLTVRTGTEREVDARKRKKPVEMYPAYAILITLSPSPTGKVVTIDGKQYKREQVRVNLYPDEEPKDSPKLS
ncbi:hypothetical protein BST81_13740 [Leptolyngbya sp. 'hensonii']|uniref:hypothetical protein n=1 Tax=Leptolyngbya sp. 'hensonii' TaxID=1922337 RepID=UPI0009501A38|nr:hypothetical protein [Leptolyngbya sp. 'hensonii']OLP18082.1 hypothetical protein BST81_13740 [Leptolyngbya sp. 'hensonii']